MWNLNWLYVWESLSGINRNTAKRRRRRLPLPVAAEVLERRLCLSAAPAMASLSLNNDTGEAGDNITTDPSLVGTITNDGSTNGIELEIDLGGGPLADDWAFANSQGVFTYDPTGKISVGEVTIRVRALEWDDAAMVYLYSDWISITFTYENPTDPPEVTSLNLRVDTDEAGDNITSNPALIGTVASGGDLDGMELEVDVDDDGLADDWAFADAGGTFVYNPAGNITFGEVTIQVRAIQWDEVTMNYLYSEWMSITFTYVNPNAPPQVASLSLLSDTGQAGDNITQNPILVGTVTNDGNTNGLELEVDLDGDGLADDWAFANANGGFQYDPSNAISYGEVTIQVRAIEWDGVAMQYLYGDWVSITFTYSAPYYYGY